MTRKLRKEWRYCEAPGCINRVALSVILCEPHKLTVEPMHLAAILIAEEEMKNARIAYETATERVHMALARLRGALPPYCRLCSGSCLKDHPPAPERGGFSELRSNGVPIPDDPMHPPEDGPEEIE